MSNREEIKLHRAKLKAQGVCVDCGGRPKDGEGSVLCAECKSDRRVRAKMNRGLNVKKYRRLSADKKHLNFLLQQEALEKLLNMVGQGNKSWFVEQLILREHARREKRAQKDEVVCTTSCATFEPMQHSG